MSSNQFELPFEHHPDLYLPAGDVVLAARTSPSTDDLPSTRREDVTPKYWLFRVHKFLLSHHSATFANLFADASASAGEMYDGVPLVRMEGDRAQDLALLLTYMYYPAYVFRSFSHNFRSRRLNAIGNSTSSALTLTSRLFSVGSSAWQTSTSLI